MKVYHRANGFTFASSSSHCGVTCAAVERWAVVAGHVRVNALLHTYVQQGQVFKRGNDTSSAGDRPSRMLRRESSSAGYSASSPVLGACSDDASRDERPLNFPSSYCCRWVAPRSWVRRASVYTFEADSAVRHRCVLRHNIDQNESLGGAVADCHALIRAKSYTYIVCICPRVRRWYARRRYFDAHSVQLSSSPRLMQWGFSVRL